MVYGRYKDGYRWNGYEEIKVIKYTGLSGVALDLTTGLPLEIVERADAVVRRN